MPFRVNHLGLFVGIIPLLDALDQMLVGGRKGPGHIGGGTVKGIESAQMLVQAGGALIVAALLASQSRRCCTFLAGNGAFGTLTYQLMTGMTGILDTRTEDGQISGYREVQERRGEHMEWDTDEDIALVKTYRYDHITIPGIADSIDGLELVILDEAGHVGKRDICFIEEVEPYPIERTLWMRYVIIHIVGRIDGEFL